MEREFNRAPKSIDHSLHLPVLVSAIFKISPYLGNIMVTPQLLHIYLSVLRKFHEIPLMNWELIGKLHLSHFGSLGIHRMKSLSNHCKIDFRGSSLSSIFVFLTISSGINLLT